MRQPRTLWCVYLCFSSLFNNLNNSRYTYFSNPRNASASITLILFSYSVRISSVSSPSNALLWICEILLWFKFKINKWWRFFSAVEGTFCNWFWETSSWVSSSPGRNKSKYRINTNDTYKPWSKFNSLKLWYVGTVVFDMIQCKCKCGAFHNEAQRCWN